jgi:taurine dioxygenase
VRTHPDTGRKLIFVNDTFTSRINELSQGESREMLALLCDHVVKEKYWFRVRWRPDTIAIWDNHGVQHVPMNDYWPARRRMERVTIGDTRRPA